MIQQAQHVHKAARIVRNSQYDALVAKLESAKFTVRAVVNKLELQLATVLPEDVYYQTHHGFWPARGTYLQADHLCDVISSFLELNSELYDTASDLWYLSGNDED